MLDEKQRDDRKGDELGVYHIMPLSIEILCSLYLKINAHIIYVTHCLGSYFRSVTFRQSKFLI